MLQPLKGAWSGGSMCAGAGVEHKHVLLWAYSLQKPSPCNCILSTSTVHHSIQSATSTAHMFARFLHTQTPHPIWTAWQWGAIPFSFSLATSAIHTLQGAGLCYCLSLFRGCFPSREEEKEEPGSRAAESLVMSRHVWRALSPRWVAHGCTGTRLYHGFHGLSRFITRSCYHIGPFDLAIQSSVEVKAVLRRRGTSAKQLFALQVPSSEQALTIAYLQCFACFFSIFFVCVFHQEPCLCHDSMSQA